MILQSLISYAERGALGDSDFESIGVRWMIPLAGNGKLAGNPILLSENPDEKKPRPRQYSRPFTSPNELNQGTKSHFLCDTLERAVLFLDPKAADKAEARRVQHAYFVSLLREASANCASEANRLLAVVSFLEDGKALPELARLLTDLKAKPTDNVTFSVDGWMPIESESLRLFWRERRAASASEAGPSCRRICIATGRLAETVNTTDKIKGVPGGLAVGTNLISFDKDAFCSFGLEQAQNAALSTGAELKMRSALNDLVGKAREQRLVFNGTVHLHWTRLPIQADPMAIFANPDENSVAALFRAVNDGREILGVEANAYYAMGLSGNGARVVVRDWIESTVPDVQRNVAEWFSNLAIVHPDGTGVKRDFKFGAILYALVRADLEELPPSIPTQLLYCALRGRPLPRAALAAALRRQQLDQEGKVNPARIALIKACLLRSSIPQTTRHELMTETLNNQSNDPAYICGRLFAVFDRIQYFALGSVNAGVVERYYASASVTPALVMGRLFRNAQFHLAKVEGGVAENVRKDFESLASALGRSFPSTFDLEAQGRFALGFYQQKADYRRKAAERKAADGKEAAEQAAELTI